MAVQLPDLTFVILDTETTGFVPRVHKIMEFAAITVKNREIVNTYEQLFSIDDQIPPHVRVLTRIHEDDLKEKPTFAEKKDEMMTLFEGDVILVGQNIPFDLSMLKGEGIDLTERAWIDTSMLSSVLFPELASYSLGYMSTVLRLTHEPKHRALGDVRATLALLERCTERLQELTAEDVEIIRGLAQRGPAGYKKFFSACEGTAKKQPKWLAMPRAKAPKAADSDITRVGESGERTECTEESLDPATLQEVIASLARKKGESFVVAVKNLDATLRKIELPDDVVVLRPPEHHIDREAVKRLLAQEYFTTDELTLAIKLYLYDPAFQTDLPLHGEEYSVWRGKIARATYEDEKQENGRIVLMSHDQLLSEERVNTEARVVIEDASMLEDTATKAFGWSCDIAPLRAGAEGNVPLTKFCDLLQIWIEKTRKQNDVHYLSAADLSSAEATGLREQLSDVIASCFIPRSVRALKDLKQILEIDNLGGRIVWIETMLGGNQSVKSVPLDIAHALEEKLFSVSPVSLLIPAKSEHLLRVILPDERKRSVVSFPEEELKLLPMSFDAHWEKMRWMEEVTGKVVLLAGSRRIIEDVFVRYTEKLEDKGVTLICQGMNGGVSRMQAEFAAAPSPTILVMTPWMYEMIELPAGTVDELVIESLPFDHPSHAVLKKRSELFGSAAFDKYSLPRVMLRLFRLMRTFARHRTESGNIVIADNRMETKAYGMRVREYMEHFMKNDAQNQSVKPVKEKNVTQEKTAKKEPKKKTEKKTPPNELQQALFD